MTSRAAATLRATMDPRFGERGMTGGRTLASALSGVLHRAVRLLAGWRDHARAADRSCAGRGRRDDWRSVAEERFVGRSVDAADVERRQRAWDRDESNAYSLSGWS